MCSSDLEEVGDKVIFKGEPGVASPTGHVVKEKIIDVSNEAVEKCQAQEPCDIADKKCR